MTDGWFDADFADLPRRIHRSIRVPQAPPVAMGEEARPDGVSDRAIEAIWRAVEGFYRSGLHPAFQVCIYHDGQIVLDRAIGHARGNSPDDSADAEKVPVSLDTPFLLYSASKGVTAFLILKLDELGVFHIEDRVADFIPEFAARGKGAITIRQLLSHRAGIPVLPRGVDMTDAEAVLQAIFAARPIARPGQLQAYHASSGGYVLAEIVRRVTGSSIRKALRKHIAKPLGLKRTRYGVSPKYRDAVAEDAFTGFPVLPPVSWFIERALGDTPEGIVAMANGERFRAMISPSANVVTTARELARFYMCLANGGSLDGTEVWRRDTVRRATAEQSYYELDFTLGGQMRWGVGVMLGDRASIFGLRSEACFGHLGFTNMLGWADPERKLGVAVLNSGKPFLSPYAAQLATVAQAVTHAFAAKRRAL